MATIPEQYASVTKQFQALLCISKRMYGRHMQRSGSGGAGVLVRLQVQASIPRPGVVRSPLQPEETRGLARSGDISRMLPFEAHLMAAGSQRRAVRLRRLTLIAPFSDGYRRLLKRLPQTHEHCAASREQAQFAHIFGPNCLPARIFAAAVASTALCSLALCTAMCAKPCGCTAALSQLPAGRLHA